MRRESLAAPEFPWYGVIMEPTPFDLTPEQKGMLSSLSRETGRPIPALIAKALEVLQEREHVDHVNSETNGHETVPSSPTPSQKARKPIWEALIEASLEIPEEELDLLPADGATQHDHYIYGTPKRPA
jgi:hypothetical protein